MSNDPEDLIGVPIELQTSLQIPAYKARGRTLLYTQEIADEICWRLSSGETLRQMCRISEHMPELVTVMDWVRMDVDGFAKRYREARENGVEAIVDEAIEIVDDGTNDWIDRETRAGNIIKVVDHECVARSRLRADQRNWYAEKIAPRRFANRLELTGANGEPLGGTVRDDDRITLIVALLDRARARMAGQVLESDSHLDSPARPAITGELDSEES